MTKEVEILNMLEDELIKVEREKEVGWKQWLALGRVVYFLLYERIKDKRRAQENK